MTKIISVLSAPPTLYSATPELTFSDHWDHFLARVGYHRGDHRVLPGLYRLGSPDETSPVFVSANYTLSFDALRSALRGINGYILVLDTKGINVWCAAGKHTFGTREIVRRVKETQLASVVNHRKLILPQLGAPGVAAHEVRRLCGFTVEYGQVLASDLPEYLKTHQASPEMREVKFPLHDRLILTPVEVTMTFLPMLGAAVVAFLIGGWAYALAVLTAVLGGTVLFPALLPWLPSKDFSSKGGFLGMVLSLVFVLWVLSAHVGWSWYRQLGQSLGYLLALAGSVAYISLNFTGSSTFTSRTGVKKEIYTYIRPMAISFGVGIVLLIVFAFVR